MLLGELFDLPVDFQSAFLALSLIQPVTRNDMFNSIHVIVNFNVTHTSCTAGAARPISMRCGRSRCGYNFSTDGAYGSYP